MTFKYCPLCASPMNPYEEDGFQRERCSNCGWVHYHNSRPTASAIIAKNGKVLLCQRAAGPFKGKWDLPGGFIEERESPEGGLQREMKEELGIDLKDVRLLAVTGPAHYPFGGQDNYNTDIYYVVDLVGEPKAVEKSDVAAIAWFDPNHLPDMAFDTNVKAIDAWKASNPTSADQSSNHSND